jgi:tetratricopeptide (TPR) repeat protein
METQDPRIDELRRAAVADPRNGEIRYLLGVELAQHRRYDDAVLELSAAVALDPLLHTARFQLGLLHLTMAQPHHATAVLAPLENLEESAALKHFKRGLEALAVDDLAAAVASLERGMQLNVDNAPLNADMKMLTDRIVATINSNAAASATAADTVDSKANAVRTDFSLYGLTRH